MKTYQAVRAEIAKLEQKAEALRQRELKSIVAQIRQTMAEYGLTLADLGGRRSAAPKRGKAARGGAKGTPKYRNPETQETWTGHGRPPAWILAAKDRSAFLIGEKPQSSTAAKRAKGAKAAKTGRPVKKATAKKAAARKPAAKKRSTARKGAARRGAGQTPAVQIESGVATE